MTSLPVAVSARPRFGEFSFAQYQVEPGATIEGLAHHIAADMPAGFHDTAVAIWNDSLPVPYHRWKDITPLPGDSVFFVDLPRKGGQTTQIIAAVAIVAAQTAAYFIPGVGPFVSLAIGIGGSFLLAALAPKQGGQKQKSPKQIGDGGFTGNTLAPYDQLPMVLGARRVAPFYLAPAITKFSNDSAYGTAIVGLAGRTELTAPMADGSPIEVLREHSQDGEDADEDPTIYTETIWQEQGGEFSRHDLKTDTTNDERFVLAHSADGLTEVELYDLPKYLWYRLGNIAYPDEVHFDLLFDQGIRTNNGNKAGTAFELVLKLPDGTIIYLPSLHWAMNTESPVRGKIIVKFGVDNVAGTAPSSSKAWRVAYESADYQVNHGRQAHSYYINPGFEPEAFHTESLDQTTVRIWVDPNQMPTTLGMSIGIRQGAGYIYSRFAASDGDYNFDGVGPFVPNDYFGYIFNVSTSEFMCIEDQSKVVSHCVLQQVSRYFPVQPIHAGGFAYYECETKNQRVDQISVMARRYVGHIWNRSTQEWEPVSTLSRNCGAVLYDHCLNPSPVVNALPLSVSKVDALAIGKFYEHCEDLNLECNAFITPGADWWTVYKEICEAGLGRATASQKYGVYIEKDRRSATPVQVFSPRNSANFQVERQYDRKPQAFRVTFDDKNDGYQTSPDLLVPAPGYSIDGVDLPAATLYESRHYAYITDKGQARYRADLELKIIHYRNKVYSFETDMRWLRSPRGSLVAIAQYTLDEAHGWAAIRDVVYTDVGGTLMISGLALDMEIDLRPTTTGIVINALDGDLIAAQTTMKGNGWLIQFDTPIANDPYIASGAHIVVGEVGSEYIRAIVDDIVPLDRGSARMICYDEAPELWS